MMSKGEREHVDKAVHKWWREAEAASFNFNAQHPGDSEYSRFPCDQIADNPQALLDAMCSDGILVKHIAGHYHVPAPHVHVWNIAVVLPQQGREIAVRWSCATCPESTWGTSVRATPPPT